MNLAESSGVYPSLVIDLEVAAPRPLVIYKTPNPLVRHGERGRNAGQAQTMSTICIVIMGVVAKVRRSEGRGEGSVRRAKAFYSRKVQLHSELDYTKIQSQDLFEWLC